MDFGALQYRVAEHSEDAPQAATWAWGQRRRKAARASRRVTRKFVLERPLISQLNTRGCGLRGTEVACTLSAVPGK